MVSLLLTLLVLVVLWFAVRTVLGSYPARVLLLVDLVFLVVLVVLLLRWAGMV